MRPKPRTQKNPRPRTVLPKTDPLEAKDRMLEGKAQDQAHRRKCSPKKRSSEFFFRRSLKIKVFKNFFQAIYKLLTIQKIVLSSSRGQSNFGRLETSRPRTFSWTPPLLISKTKSLVSTIAANFARGYVDFVSKIKIYENQNK